MTLHRINHINGSMNMSQILLGVLAVELSLAASLQAVDLPPELPLWEKPPPDHAIRHDVKEQVRSHKARPGSPSGLNRVFSSVSSPTYSIHRPQTAATVLQVSPQIVAPTQTVQLVMDVKAADLAVIKQDAVTVNRIDPIGL